MKLRIPIWLRSILIGFLILELGTRLWSLLALANIKSTPSIPWAFPLMALCLWFIWNYLNGKWKPKSTQEKRQLWMRAYKLEPRKKLWAWISAILLGCSLLLLILISTRLIDFPSGQIEQIERISVYSDFMVMALIIMTSVVAGVIEEIAFRAYMQKPMENEYAPAIAILIVALFFSLLHLPNATIAPQLLLLFFLGSLGWGVLAYLTNSIIPGVIIHSLVDIISYFWLWQNLELAKSLAAENIFQEGIDKSFVLLLLFAVASISALVFSFWKLSKIR
ncbi:MAG: CPBP family intramembrane glutamic endopeptidase [Bacteroidia bacterium]|nr:CPBP family intramembrane glutamic endopeptidase [Bacteroidia bacterium]